MGLSTAQGCVGVWIVLTSNPRYSLNSTLMVVKSEVKTVVYSEVEFWKCSHVTEGGLLFLYSALVFMLFVINELSHSLTVLRTILLERLQLLRF